MEPLKYMYNKQVMRQLGDAIARQTPLFDASTWDTLWDTTAWHEAELKQRVNLVAKAMHQTLDMSYPQAIDVLKPVSRIVGSGFFGVVFSEFVALFGREHWDKSMEAMAVFTQTSSAEFAIRHFILDDPKRAMVQMSKWSKDSNYHLRRLSSEGSRPRLPWGMKLQMFIDDPGPNLKILDQLKRDPELYVRKSVANHLNDISKDNPQVALDWASKWQHTHENTDWIVKHGLRTLLKSGNTQALSLMGQSASEHLHVVDFSLTPSVLLGEALEFSVQLQHAGTAPENMRLEYAIDYVKANGKTSRKIFQWANKTIAPGDYLFKKTQRLQDFTTRKHYPGLHGWACLINGVEKKKGKFTLGLVQ